ncbi:YchJ family metal-binding protein [Cutibacterium avidum]|uniref:YchJ family protein n=1 Tax=Cutibacterium avidum TaxID=33010 RepID=UPI00336C1BBF
MASTCPCGSGLPLDQCCGPVLDDPRRAETAEAIMRSRYTANVLGRWNHLWATRHPRTRPDVVDSAGIEWTGLTIMSTEDGQPGDITGVVEFRATYRAGGHDDALHEISRFQRRAGRWMYVDGDID